MSDRERAAEIFDRLSKESVAYKAIKLLAMECTEEKVQERYKQGLHRDSHHYLTEVALGKYLFALHEEFEHSIKTSWLPDHNRVALREREVLMSVVRVVESFLPDDELKWAPEEWEKHVQTWLERRVDGQLVARTWEMRRPGGSFEPWEKFKLLNEEEREDPTAKFGKGKKK